MAQLQFWVYVTSKRDQSKKWYSAKLLCGSEVDLLVRVFRGISSLLGYGNSTIRNISLLAFVIITVVILEMANFEPLTVRSTSRQANPRAMAPRGVSSLAARKESLFPSKRTFREESELFSSVRNSGDKSLPTHRANSGNTVSLRTICAG